MKTGRDIVVIGAGLGGVTAIAKLALVWPADLPTAVLIALAAPVQPPAIVLQIIDSYAPIDVAYAREGEVIALRKIYLSPPGVHMTVGPGGVVQLQRGGTFDASTPSINRLFAAAASVYGPRVIGVLLSGSSKDGTQGMLDIEAGGGVGIVQHPDDAIEPLMPHNAMMEDHPRYAVKAAEIPRLVQRLMRAERTL